MITQQVHNKQLLNELGSQTNRASEGEELEKAGAAQREGRELAVGLSHTSFLFLLHIWVPGGLGLLFLFPRTFLEILSFTSLPA